jgi:cytochrome c556
VEQERAKSPEWQNWAGKFTATVNAAAVAADRRDRMALIAASDALVEACEGCHTAFPPDPTR